MQIVSWEPNEEEDLAGYKLYLNGKLLRTIPNPLITTIEISIVNLNEGENIFNLTAYNRLGIESEFSADAIFIKSIPPMAPINVVVEPMAGTPPVELYD